ncbi:MAG: efflux RND transporter periplasmic adaptor subunit [Nitrospiraceae bacterium]|nr:efflux RND transporter periplasmic adaptor subunit [Nitrospiraceae bacterium]
MKPEIRRRVFVISVGLVVLLAIGYGFLPKPVSVDMARAAFGPLRVTVEEEGRTRVKDRFVLSAPVAGYLRRIELQAGDLVKKGQQVALLEPLRSTVLDPRSKAEAEAAVAAAKATLDAAKEKSRAAAADADYARDHEKRMQQLAANGHIAKNDLDQAVAESRKAEAMRLSAEAAVTAAKADLERAESVLRYSAAEKPATSDKTVVLRSPEGGRVLKLHRESEGVVAAAEPLIDIGNPGSLEVKAEVLSADAVKLHPGSMVLFERWGGEKPLEGKVRVVEPSGFTKVSSLGVEEQRVNVIVDFTSPFELWKQLGDGYRLDTTFILWESPKVLQVPASALFRNGDGWALYTIENRRAKLIAVDVGKRNGTAAEIAKGLAKGAAVIANPDDNIKDGIRVKVRSTN